MLRPAIYTAGDRPSAAAAALVLADLPHVGGPSAERPSTVTAIAGESGGLQAADIWLTQAMRHLKREASSRSMACRERYYRAAAAPAGSVFHYAR